MFKKTKIAAVTAAVLGLAAATSANAVTLKESSGTGQVLIFPYYNVNNGFSTGFNITNTTADFKAVKMRFRESKTSNDVLDFNVYMSPQDRFTVSLSQAADGGVLLTTTDKTCTFPAIPAAGKKFIGASIYDSVKTADIREGYLEVIEMGVLDSTALVGGSGTNKAKTIASGVLHKSGTPANCSYIADAWAGGKFKQGGARANTDWATFEKKLPISHIKSDAGYYGKKPTVAGNNLGGLTKPTGGLAGSSILIDTVNIAGFVAEPTVIDGYSNSPQHYKPSDPYYYLLPSLASGDSLVVSSLDAAGTALATGTWRFVARDFGLDDPNLAPNTSVPSGINPMPIAQAMLVTSVANQYFVGGGASTDWVISTPMRKHGVYNNYQYTADANFNTSSTSKDIKVNGGTNPYWKYVKGDISANFIYYNSEEGTVNAAPADFSPPLQSNTPAVPFNNEVNILALTSGGANPSVLGSANAQTLTMQAGFTSGWGTFDFSALDLGAARYTGAWTTHTAGTKSTKGAPVHGFASARGKVNGQNLGETFPMITNK